MPSLDPPRPSSPAWSTAATCGHCAPDPEDLALLPPLSLTTSPASTATTRPALTPTESTSTTWSMSATWGSHASSRTATPDFEFFDIFETAPAPLRRQPKILRGGGAARAASRGNAGESVEGSPFEIWLVYEELLRGGDEAEEGKGKGKEREEVGKVDGDKGAQVGTAGERHVKWKSDLPSAAGERLGSGGIGGVEGRLERRDGESAVGMSSCGSWVVGDEAGVRKTKKIAAVDTNRMCRSSL